MADRHLISVLLENTSGALSRVVGLFSARGYNIDSVTVAATENPAVSRMTIVSHEDAPKIEQITKHLNRLVEVIKVYDLLDNDFVERELMLVKLRAVGRDRDELMRIAEIFRARIVDVNDKTYTIEVTGDRGKLDAFIKTVDSALILETVRTGACGIARGERVLRA
ncbi:MAG: acetolactate synthase small subunit [Duodenibacillus sp.]